MKFDNILSETYKCVKIGGILRNLNNDETKLYNLIKNKGRLFKDEMDEYNQHIALSMVSKGLLKRKRLKDPESKWNGHSYYTTIGRNGHLKGNALDEVAPPGKDAESWIKKNKKRFKEKYGKDYEKYLYGKAWNNYNGKKKIKESVGDEDKENKYKQEFIQRVGRHINGVNHFAAKIGKSYPNHDYDKLNSQLLNYYYLDKKSDYEELSDKEKDILRKAGMKHRTSNPHHPEYWDKGNIENLTTIRSNPTKPFNCQKMPQSALEEMCADWCSMSEEFGNTPFEWWEKIKNKRYLFTPEQEQFILDTLSKMWNLSVNESEELNEYDMLVEDITAYHGSPNDFDQFDTKFMGDGQGAQAHGWGLYFALDPKTSRENYQDRYGGNHGLVSYTFNGKTYKKPKMMYYVLKDIHEGNLDSAIHRLEKYKSDEEFKKNHPNANEIINRYIEDVKKYDPHQIKKNVSMTQGQFYTVKLPDVENYLAEESNYYQQPTKIQKKLLRVYKSLNLNPAHLTQKNIDGERIYDEIKDELKSKRKASLKLLEYGIKGIYYNGYSDGWCVVIFDHNDVQIVKKDNDWKSEDDELPANITDILLDDPNQVEKYDNLPTDTQVALFNQDNLIISKIKNPTDEFLEYVCNMFISGDVKNYAKFRVIPYIFDKLSNEQKNELYDKDVLFLFACGDKLSDAEIKKYAARYSDSEHPYMLEDLGKILKSGVNLDDFPDRLFNQIFDDLFSQNIWGDGYTYLKVCKDFMNSFYNKSRWDSSYYRITTTPSFKKLELYLWPSNLTSKLTVENCKIVDRIFDELRNVAAEDTDIGTCRQFREEDVANAEPDACDYILKWSNEHPKFVNDIIASEDFVNFCGFDKILKNSNNISVLVQLAETVKWSPGKHINFYNMVYTSRYKEMKLLNLSTIRSQYRNKNYDERDMVRAFVEPAISIFDSLEEKAKINLIKLTPRFLFDIGKQSLIKLWNYYCDYDMQKQIVVKDV